MRFSSYWFVLTAILLANSDELNLILQKFARPLYFFSRQLFGTLSHELVRQSEELWSRITFNVQQLHRKERNSSFYGPSVACSEAQTARDLSINLHKFGKTVITLPEFGFIFAELACVLCAPLDRHIGRHIDRCIGRHIGRICRSTYWLNLIG